MLSLRAIRTQATRRRDIWCQGAVSAVTVPSDSELGNLAYKLRASSRTGELVLTKVTPRAAFSALLEAGTELEKVSSCSGLWTSQVALGLSLIAALGVNDSPSTRYMTGPTSTVWMVILKFSGVISPPPPGGRVDAKKTVWI